MENKFSPEYNIQAREASEKAAEKKDEVVRENLEKENDGDEKAVPKKTAREKLEEGQVAQEYLDSLNSQK